MKIFPNLLFAPASIKAHNRWEVMTGKWAIESADGRGDEGGCAWPHLFQKLKTVEGVQKPLFRARGFEEK